MGSKCVEIKKSSGWGPEEEGKGSGNAICGGETGVSQPPPVPPSTTTSQSR